MCAHTCHARAHPSATDSGLCDGWCWFWCAAQDLMHENEGPRTRYRPLTIFVPVHRRVSMRFPESPIESRISPSRVVLRTCCMINIHPCASFPPIADRSVVLYSAYLLNIELDSNTDFFMPSIVDRCTDPHKKAVVPMLCLFYHPPTSNIVGRGDTTAAAVVCMISIFTFAQHAP